MRSTKRVVRQSCRDVLSVVIRRIVNRNPVGVTLLTKDAIEMKGGHSYGVRPPTEGLEFGHFWVALLAGRIWFSSPIIRNSQVGKGGLPPLPSQFE